MPFPKASAPPRLRAMRVDAEPPSGPEPEPDPVQLAPEAERFVALLVERGLVELEAERGTFVGDVGAILRIKGNVNVRARGLYQLLERHPAVAEFFVLDEEDLVTLLEEWG